MSPFLTYSLLSISKTSSQSVSFCYVERLQSSLVSLGKSIEEGGVLRMVRAGNLKTRA